MNGVRVEYEASLKQTSKGIWYVDTVRCGDDNIEGLGAKMHLLMQEMEQVLFRHNYPEQLTTEDKLNKAAGNYKKGIATKPEPEKKEE